MSATEDVLGAPTKGSAEDSGLAATRGKRNGALDGLRGLAVIAVMAYHVVPDPFTGGWLGVDVFFVLSGFLICSMLLREHARSRTIDYKRFLVRRARRLLPGLALVLTAVLLAAMIWESAGRRVSVAIDVVSSAFQVSNWRLILADESYFTKVGVPSPIRHTWSLGVQEQFYLLFPLLLLFVMSRAKSWRTVYFVFGSIAAMSLARALSLYEPGTDPSRVYFGTDTRLSELLIGAIGAMFIFRRTQIAQRYVTPGPRMWSRQTETLLGWLGLGSLALIVYWMFSVDEFSPWLFQGGLILISFITLIIIVAATSPVPNIMTKLLANKPLMKAGDMSYSLYIWHWPIIVYLTPALPGSSMLTRQIMAVVLTIGVSWASFHLVENRIHKHGLSGLSWRNPQRGPRLAAATLPAIAALALVLAVTPGSSSGKNLVLKLPADALYGLEVEDLPDGLKRKHAVLIGASTADGIITRGDVDATPDIYLRSSAKIGCAPFTSSQLQGEDLLVEGPECDEFREEWPQVISEMRDPTVILFLMTQLLNDFEVDGKRVSPPSPEYESEINRILDEFKATASENGARRIALINLSCHDRFDFGNDIAVTRSNSIETTQYLNGIAAAWATANDAEIYDNYALLCPGDEVYDKINGVQLYDDGLHYTEAAAPLIWQWIADRIRQHAKND